MILRRLLARRIPASVLASFLITFGALLGSQGALLGAILGQKGMSGQIRAGQMRSRSGQVRSGQTGHEKRTCRLRPGGGGIDPASKDEAALEYSSKSGVVVLSVSVYPCISVCLCLSVSLSLCMSCLLYTSPSPRDS